MNWNIFKSVKTVATACVLVATVGSGFVFSTASRKHLDETCPQLIQVTERALELSTVDFKIIDGMRTNAEHQRNIRNGKSWITRSKHQDGLAIDLQAFVDGKGTWAEGKEEEIYRPIVDAFKQASEELGYPITAGGDWRVRDYGHIELKGKCQWPQIADKSE